MERHLVYILVVAGSKKFFAMKEFEWNYITDNMEIAFEIKGCFRSFILNVKKLSRFAGGNEKDKKQVIVFMEEYDIKDSQPSYIELLFENDGWKIFPISSIAYPRGIYNL